MHRPIHFALCLALALAACQREPEVRVTHEPKAPQKLAFTAPAGWIEQSAGDVRQASFLAGPTRLDASVTAFPGDAGGLLANVNRWRRQLDLPPLASESDAAPRKILTAAGQPALAFDLESSDRATLGAILSRPGRTWFVKLTGPRDAVLAERENFDAFVRSLHVP
jgi:hypothetical protein